MEDSCASSPRDQATRATPSLARSPESSGFKTNTPMEPVRVEGSARMTSAAAAAR
jgi:hypothetical protein